MNPEVNMVIEVFIMMVFLVFVGYQLGKQGPKARPQAIDVAFWQMIDAQAELGRYAHNWLESESAGDPENAKQWRKEMEDYALPLVKEYQEAYHQQRIKTYEH